MLDNKQIMMAKALLNIQQVNNMINKFFIWIFMLLGCVMLSNPSFAAPPTIETFVESGVTTNGPQTSALLQTFRLNANNPSDNLSTAYAPLTTATYTITNSVYNTATYGGYSNQPELVFGGGAPTSNNEIGPAKLFQHLRSMGNATNDMFAASIQNAVGTCSDGSACSSGTTGGIYTGVSTSNAGTNSNYGVAFFILTKGIANTPSSSRPSTSARVKVGTVKIEFNRPVSNPILQASGLGGTIGSFGLSAEFTLTGSNVPVTMTRIAGSKELSVSGNNITNNASTISATSGSGGASGSVYIQGKSIQTLTFDIYVRGDGGGNWRATAGDAFFFGISSMDADSDVTLVKKQRVGKTATFVQTQLNDVPVNSLMQYQLEITNNTPTGATLGGTVVNLPFDDTLPISLKDVSVVSTTPTTPSGASPTTACTSTLTGNNTAGWKISGLFTGVTTAKCTIILQGTATQIGTLSNTAYIDSTSSTTRVSSAVNANIIAPSPITPDPVIKEARFTITPDLPTIVRGRIGTQTINIKNEGPDAATNPKATYVAAPQTGVIVSSVSVVGGSACVQSGNNWNCNLGGSMANGVTQQLLVTYATASNSALGTAQQATVKAYSDEFNPGSGVGETLYKVWGTNQQNEYRPNGAFWVGYEGISYNSSGVGTPSGSYYNEQGTTSPNSLLLPKWPLADAGPSGAYLQAGKAGPLGQTGDSVYYSPVTNASPMMQKIITNMSADPDRRVSFTKVNEDDLGDNRRAWEFTTGVYIASSQQIKLCIGNTEVGIDDGGYIMIDGALANPTTAVINGWQQNGVNITSSSPLSVGYHRITYRIVNRNTYTFDAERPEGGYDPVGLALASDSCSTANYDIVTGTGIPARINIIDGAKIKIAKTSINGFGTFNFSSLTNLVNSTTDTTTDSVVTVTAGTEATSTTQLWAKVLNTAISITEDTATGYNLTGVSCTDANSVSAGTFGSLASNILTIPANRITEGANITCTFTNTKVIIVDISGRVFNDNSGTTGDATKAYNVIQDAGEIGIANSTIRLSDCNALTIGTTTTNANGDYGFSIVQTNLPTSFCIAQTNLPEYLSVNADSITVAKTSATSYPNNNFADVKLNVLLTEDGQHTITAGEVTDYPHRLSTQAPVWVTQLEQIQSNSNNDQPWQALVYRDSDCNGTVDTGETVFNPSNLLLQPNADICLVQRVFAPTNIFAGAQHIGKLQASYAVAALSLTNQKTQQRQDVTLIGSAGLTLTKKVRTVSSCTSTPSDSLGFLVNNEATKQQNLEYEITYKNNSVKNLQNVKVKDSLPTGTNFGSLSCGLTPSGNTCNATRSGEVLEWTLTGLLKPSATGTLRFCVSQ